MGIKVIFEIILLLDAHLHYLAVISKQKPRYVQTKHIESLMLPYSGSISWDLKLKEIPKNKIKRVEIKKKRIVN